MRRITLLLFGLSYMIISCGGDESPSNPSPPTPTPDITLSVADGITTEGNMLSFQLNMSSASTEDISVTYSVNGITAQPGVDFEAETNSVTIDAGQRTGEIQILTLDDTINELQERITIELTDAGIASIDGRAAQGIIRDNDTSDVEGDYTTPTSHFGYNLSWSDEFDEVIDPDSYTFEAGDGCPDLCGWGNNELQIYTEENAFIRDGSLVIRADRNGGVFESARMITKGKREFSLGRIDVRAKLPEGQGLWPAIWMLGSNIDEVGWPNCGEIDIMELVGHEPEEVHGTAHWGPPGRSFSDFKTGTKTESNKFSEEYHVFTLLWEQDLLVWYLDEEEFFRITPSDVTSTAYPFNGSFFFIFNVAVGGNWPGNPDATTVFPQEMEIDYIRVFQEQ